MNIFLKMFITMKLCMLLQRKWLQVILSFKRQSKKMLTAFQQLMTIERRCCCPERGGYISDN